MKYLLLAILTNALFFLTACQDFHAAQATQDEEMKVAPSPSGVTVTPATSEECPSGGVVVINYQDNNYNNVFDAGDEVISRKKICNEQKGESEANEAVSQ